MVRVVVGVLGWLCVMGSMCAARADIWLNESGAIAEADFASLQTPLALSLQASQTSGLIYGELFEAGLTEAVGAPANVLAAVGYGPAASDPRTSSGWSWFDANYDAQIGATDQFHGSFAAPAAGSYSYTYRFSLDNGDSWTLGDANGAGAGVGRDFSVAQLGAMTVTAAPADDLDVAKLITPASLSLIAGQSTGLIYGQVFEMGITSIPGEPGGITANIGYGPAGSDPRSSPHWTWSGANYHQQVGSDDSFFGAFLAPATNGTYGFTMRFSQNNGATWTVADLDGFGAIGGQSFSLSQLGLLTVTGGIAPSYNPADFSKNRLVDGADVAKWRTAFAANNMADADGDGDSDGNDFLRWQRALGAFASEPAAEQVPEPTAATLAALAALVFNFAAFRSRSQRRKRYSSRS